MKPINKILCTCLLLASSLCQVQGQNIDEASFNNINLNYKGLEKVKELVGQKKYNQAGEKLLVYYRNRISAKLPGTDNFALNAPLPKNIKEGADNALLHLFKPHKGYGYFDYGKDKINWLYLPNNEYEVKVQLHRLGWWPQMALAYQSTANETYAKEWVSQFVDWNTKMAYNKSTEVNTAAWRPLETCARIKVFTEVFDAFVQSPSFTPQFLLSFLNATVYHGKYITSNYSARGNHLLFEAEAMIKAGCFFPELNLAETWRKSGISILTEEITKQVKPDGFQWEMSVNYHMAMISTFWNSLEMAQMAGMQSEFPESYPKTLEKMVLAVVNICFPDYSFPQFGDTWASDKENMLKNFRKWSIMFPNNSIIQYFATDGKKGQKPNWLTKGLTDIGFYTFRNGWTDTATVMVMKASQPGEFHAQPDNGTFDLWVRGRNFTPDAGVHAYGGDAEIMKKRNWYRQTRIHSTLTLDNKDMVITKANLLKWDTTKNLSILNYSNPSYPNLQHQRTVLFINRQYFIIIDQASGTSTGNIGVHYVLKEDAKPIFNHDANLAYTTYQDKNNLLIQYFGQDKAILKEEEGKVSYAYGKESPRPAFVFEMQKTDGKPKQFITVLYPFNDSKIPQIKLVENKGNDFEKGNINLKLIIDGQESEVKTTL